MQVVLEVLVGVETQRADDADDGGWTGLKPAGHVADIEEDELARVFEDRADDLATRLAELLQLEGHAGRKVRMFGLSFDRHTDVSPREIPLMAQVRTGAARGAAGR